MNIKKIEIIINRIKDCFDHEKLIKAKKFYDNSNIIIEGANGSIGQSFFFGLKSLGLNNIKLILTNKQSKISNLWSESGYEILNFSDRNKIFDYINSASISSHVFFAAGYGQPNIFIKDPISMVNTNINQVIEYGSIKLKSFSFISTAEVYSGLSGMIKEDDRIVPDSNNLRSTYIFTKLLTESLVNNFLKNTQRKCSYRVALAFPYEHLVSDTRVLADLIKKAYQKKLVLNGGGDYIRQYQYAPMCATKILLGTAIGSSNIYNSSGNYIYTLSEITRIISEIFNVDYIIEKNNNDLSAPKSVLIDSNSLDSTIGYKDNFFSFSDALRLYANKYEY